MLTKHQGLLLSLQLPGAQLLSSAEIEWGNRQEQDVKE